MPIVYNGVTLTDIVYNGVALDKVMYNGVEVFTKAPAIIREPESGEYFSNQIGTPPLYLTYWKDSVSTEKGSIYWLTADISPMIAFSGFLNSFVYNGYTYYKGTYHHSTTSLPIIRFYSIYRIKN